MVTTLFFMWAFLTELNDILIPHLQSIFDLNYTQSMMVQFVFFTGYAIFAVPSGKLVDGWAISGPWCLDWARWRLDLS